MPTSVDSNVLYVRDDSVLNKSLDSASTSDVSYMPVIVSSENGSSSMSSNTSNVSESGTVSASSNSFSAIGNNTVSNILDANKLNGFYQCKQVLTQHEIDALYSKPLRNLNFTPMTKTITPNNSQIETMNQKYEAILKNKKANNSIFDQNQSYSRCIILSNEKVTEDKNIEDPNYIAKRTYSQRLPKTISFDTHAGLINQMNYKNKINSTVFGKERAEPNTVTKSVLFVDSSSPTDSGRDSLNESPVSSKQQTIKIKNFDNDISTVKSKQLLDTNC